MPKTNKNSKSNVHNGHRERVKNQLLSGAFGTHTPSHQLLEILLYFSVPRRDTNEIAHDLMNAFGSLSGVLYAPKEQLTKVKGVTENTAALFEIMRQVNMRVDDEFSKKRQFLRSRDEMGNYLVRRFREYKEEAVGLLFLKPAGEIIGFEIVATGDIASVGISTRKIVESVIKHSANIVVLCHNHPSGTALPSQGDIVVTTGVKEALKQIDVVLYDHIIVTHNDFVSMASSPMYKTMF